MKILKVLLLCAAIIISVVLNVSAENEKLPTVYVTISDGELRVAAKEITVYDYNGDGKSTIDDVLSIAHENFYDGGISGYESVESEFGVSLVKLWGIENGGSYGYYINDKPAQSVADSIHDYDNICVYAYSDLTAWSDVYSYFEYKNVSAVPGIPTKVFLYYAGFDENWNPIVSPLSGAVITVNGVKTEFVTDENGYAELIFDQSGVYTVSAVSDTMTIVPPVAVYTVNSTVESTVSPETADILSLCAATAISALYIAVRVKAKRKNIDE